MWYCWAKEAEFYGRSDGSSVIIVQVNHRDIAGSNWVSLTRDGARVPYWKATSFILITIIIISKTILSFILEKACKFHLQIWFQSLTQSATFLWVQIKQWFTRYLLYSYYTEIITFLSGCLPVQCVVTLYAWKYLCWHFITLLLVYMTWAGDCACKYFLCVGISLHRYCFTWPGLVYMR